MQPFWEIVAGNAVTVVLLAATVALLGRIWKNPVCLHLLWVLVLLKFVTPPLVTVPIVSRAEPVAATSRSDTGDRRPVSSTGGDVSRQTPESAADPANAYVATNDQRIPWRTVLGWTWGIGIVLVACRRAFRIVRFRRLFRHGRVPSSALLGAAERVRGRLGLGRVPEIRLLPICVSPLVWSLGGRPRVFLPSGLFERLDEPAQEAILAHELAHIRRGDHWVRLLETAVTTLFWWHPVAWWAAWRLQELEDLCCDAVAVDTAPHGAKSYATALLDTLDFLSERPVAPPLAATAAKSSISLTRRIAMLKDHSSPVRLTFGRLVLLLTAAALPMAVAFGQKPSEDVEKTESAPAATRDVDKDGAPAEKLDSPTTSVFPYQVKFEQGATRFVDGDKITIVEVRGTAKTFEPGNIYWIKGTYTLASHDKAGLAAYTTAMDAAEGKKTRSFQPQKTDVTKGSGTFTLFLPMPHRGWPHVSFYGGGTSFGGNYFGTGDSVLKRWWGSEETSTRRANPNGRATLHSPTSPPAAARLREAPPYPRNPHTAPRRR